MADQEGTYYALCAWPTLVCMWAYISQQLCLPSLYQPAVPGPFNIQAPPHCDEGAAVVIPVVKGRDLRFPIPPPGQEPIMVKRE